MLKSVDWSHDSTRLGVVGMTTGGVERVDAATGARLDPTEPVSGMRRVAAMAEGTFLGLSYGRTSTVLGPGGRVERLALGRVWDVAATPTGDRAAVVGDNGVLILEGVLHRRLAEGDYVAVAITPDGQTVAVSTGPDITLLDADGEAAGSRHAGEVHVLDIAFSPDGRWLAAGDLHGDIWLWSHPEGALVGRMRGHTGRVVSVDFTPDSGQLVSASWDASARLWDLSVMRRGPGDLVAEVESTWGLALDEVLESPLR